MKKYLCSAALMLASCAPAQSYAVTTEQCSEIKEASSMVIAMGITKNGNAQESLYFAGKNIEKMYKSISERGAFFIAFQSFNADGWDWAHVPEKMFYQCLQNDPKFNAKYFKGDLK